MKLGYMKIATVPTDDVPRDMAIEFEYRIPNGPYGKYRIFTYARDHRPVECMGFTQVLQKLDLMEISVHVYKLHKPSNHWSEQTNRCIEIVYADGAMTYSFNSLRGT